MITREDGDGEEYRLKWPVNLDNRDQEMIQKKKKDETRERNSPETVHFVVTLMMRPGSGGEDYMPKDSAEEATSGSESSTPSGTNNEDKGKHGLVKRPKKRENVDSVDNHINRTDMEILTDGSSTNRGSMAVPEEASSHHRMQSSNVNPSVPILRGGSVSKSVWTPINKSILIKKVISKSVLEGYTPLPGKIEKFRGDRESFKGHPMWDHCSPDEYCEWTKEWIWSATNGHEPNNEGMAHETRDPEHGRTRGRDTLANRNRFESSSEPLKRDLD